MASSSPSSGARRRAAAPAAESVSAGPPAGDLCGLDAQTLLDVLTAAIAAA